MQNKSEGVKKLEILQTFKTKTVISNFFTPPDKKYPQ